MSDHPHSTVGPRPWKTPLLGRSPKEVHRASTPLELFFDLVFVVAVAQNAAGLHHAISENHATEGIIRFLMIFFGIWWAWMNFSWFASAFDTDDILYRLVVFVQLTGALTLAAGVSFAFNEGNFMLMVVGYTIMRLAIVPQWIRAGRSNPAFRKTAYRYAIGVSIMQLLWIIGLLIPPSLFLPVFAVFALMELLVPIWAERSGATPWHPKHIAERYSLFTIIVLGESVLSGSSAIQVVLSEGGFNAATLEIIIGGLLILFSMWWLYFVIQWKAL